MNIDNSNESRAANLKNKFQTIAIVVSMFGASILGLPKQSLAQQAGDTTFFCDPGYTTTYNNITLNQLHNNSGFRGRAHNQQCVAQGNGGTADMVAFGVADSFSTFSFGHLGPVATFGRDIWFDTNTNTSRIEGTCVNGIPFTPGTPIKLAAGQTHTIKYNTGATSWSGTIVIALDNTLSLTNGIELTAGTIPVDQCIATATTSSETQTTEEKVATFVTARGDRIVRGMPDVLGRLTGNGLNNSNNPLGLNGSGSVGTGFAYVNANFNTDLGGFGYSGASNTANTGGLNGKYTEFGSWVSGSYSYVESGNSKSHIGLFQTGVDYRLSEDQMVGMMAQFDFTNEKNATDSTSGNGWGWLAGPYFAARLQENLYLDAVANYGQSYNKMQAVAGVTGDFKTERFLVSAKLSGDFKVKDNITINPFAKLTYFHEKQNAYTDSASNVISSQTFTLCQFEFGPKVSTKIDMEEFNFNPYISFSGIWDFNSMSTSTSTADIRGAIKSGFVIVGDDNISLNFEGFYDGIGVSNFQAYGGTLGVRVSF